VESGGGISPAAVMLLAFIVVGIGMAIALRTGNKK
jgi:hypothetical protein